VTPATDMPRMLRTAATVTVRGALMHLLPEGGQRTARRNAWTAASGEARLARERREAEQAVAAALAGYDAPLPRQRTAGPIGSVGRTAGARVGAHR
jgi:hypothetical protein